MRSSLGISSKVGLRTKLCIAGAGRLAPAGEEGGLCPPPLFAVDGAAGGVFGASVTGYALRKSPGGWALVKVCIGGGGAGAGFAAGATVACGAAAGPLAPLIIRPFQLVYRRLLIPERPPAFSDHLHGGGAGAGRLAVSGQAPALWLLGL